MSTELREDVIELCARMAVVVSSTLKASVDGAGLGKEIGFALFVFDCGDTAGTTSYASSVKRGDFLKLLDEMRGKLAATLPDDEQPPGAN